MSGHASCTAPPGTIVYEGHTGGILSVEFSPDGKSIVSGSYDGTVRLWDAHNPTAIGKLLTEHTDRVYSTSYSPLGTMVVSGSRDCTVRLWDLIASQQACKPLLGHKEEVNSVAFSPGGDFVASGSDDRTIRLWNVKSKEALSGPFRGHTGWVSSVGFAPDCTSLVSGSYDSTIRVWDIERATTVAAPLKGHTSVVRSVAISPDGSKIVSGSHDSTIRLWDTRTGSTIGQPFVGHADFISSVAFAPDGTYVASGSEDKTVRVWDIRTGSLVGEPFRQHTGEVYSVAMSPCGRRIASGSADKTIMVWDMLGSNPDVSHDSDIMSGDDAEPYDPEGERAEFEAGIEAIERHMSTYDMLNLLCRHGCVNLQETSQMDPNQHSAILLSGGGFGDIWKGELLNGTKVAIKAWRASLIEQCDYKMLKRAAREIYYWSKMKHENVHQLMGVIAFRGQSLGMVSEWMDNGNLHEYLRRNPGANRPQLSVQVASGLAYVHQCNMIHGDMKALNVLVSSDGLAKLTDFGLSTMSESSVAFSATTNSQAGSVRWMAPELLLTGSPKSKPSDVYALGMTILEIFTGTVPYSEWARDAMVIVMLMQGTQPVRPTKHFGDDGRGNQLWDLLVGCWNREPNNRPVAEEVVESLVLATGLGV